VALPGTLSKITGSRRKRCHRPITCPWVCRGGKWKDRRGIRVLSEWTILISAYSAAPLMMLIDTGAEGRTTWHGNLALILAEQQPCRWKARTNLHTSKVAKSMVIELKLASKTLYISTAQDQKQVLQAKKCNLNELNCTPDSRTNDKKSSSTIKRWKWMTSVNCVYITFRSARVASDFF